MELHARSRTRPYAVPLAALAAGGVLTVLTSFAPFIHFAYRNPSVHLVLETSAALVALLAAYLAFGRFRISGRATDLALVYPLGLFASTNLFLAALPAITEGVEPNRLATWTPAITRLLAAATFAAAAFVPGRVLASRVGAARLVMAACVATLTAAALAVAMFSPLLPRAVDDERAGVATEAPALTAHPALVATHAAAILLFALASVGLARLAVRNRDELLRWFSGGAVLAGLASLHYALSPTLYSDWVYTGDFLRVGFYILLLIGAAREIQHHWESRAQAAVLEERRRLARDLHDGVAQELAYIWRQTRRLAATADGPTVAGLTGSAERALHESRRAIAALTSAPSQSLAAAMTQAVDAVAARVGTSVVIEVADGVEVSPEAREQMLRIACEAVANAGRHGRAHVVRVEVDGGHRPRLCITDDGVGFDAASAPRPGAFGLASMAERARAMGAMLNVTSAPGQGTQVELVLP